MSDVAVEGSARAALPVVAVKLQKIKSLRLRVPASEFGMKLDIN